MQRPLHSEPQLSGLMPGYARRSVCLRAGILQGLGHVPTATSQGASGQGPLSGALLPCCLTWAIPLPIYQTLSRQGHSGTGFLHGDCCFGSWSPRGSGEGERQFLLSVPSLLTGELGSPPWQSGAKEVAVLSGFKCSVSYCPHP